MTEEPKPNRIYSEEEASAHLGMTKRQLADRRRKKKIGFIKDGHFIAYTQRHLDEFCAEHDSSHAFHVWQESLRDDLKYEAGGRKRKRGRAQTAEGRERAKRSKERMLKRLAEGTIESLLFSPDEKLSEEE